ncbi:MAG TPA: DNA recombination protein RmuC [Chryseosolibacter sp.]|jgi:DNA recombination protein RmuC|nr:DNA recombination protein RmuC [Chryseosolibacter sp.]
MEIAFVIIGLAAGGAAGWFMARLKAAAEKQKDHSAWLIEQEKTRNLQVLLDEAKELVERERQKVIDLNNTLAASEADYRNLEEKLMERKKEMDAIQERFTAEFKNLANEILEKNSAKFTDLNRNSMSELLNPLKDKILTFEKKVEEAYDKELRDKISLREEVKKLYELNNRISAEANNLTRALKGDTKKQGDWGEFILETVLERSGLTKDREYRKQVLTTNADGQTIKPDYLVLLPDKRHIIVDSKVSLTAYENFVNTDDEASRPKYLKAHLDSMKTHIKHLSEKNYFSSLEFNTPDFVLMFVPIESSFSLALQADQDLFNYAWEKKIVIVSPTTLLATMRTIASMWKMDKQSQHAFQIAEESGKLYDKFKLFMDDMVKVGNQLNSTKSTYEDAMKKLVSGRGNLVHQAEKLREMGAKNTRRLDDKITQRALESETVDNGQLTVDNQ